MYQMETFLIIILFLTSYIIRTPLNKGQNGQKIMGPKHIRYSEVSLYN